MGKTVSDLKNGPKDDKVAVASGIAVAVVVVLLVAWAIFFFHKIQSGAQQVNLSGGAQDQFNFSTVKQAQQDLQSDYANQNQDLLDIRNQAASGQLNAQQQVGQQQIQNTGSDQFGGQNTAN